ncbi:type II toxin-antitoxin system RelE/ParE family toxin [Rhodobacterales bacterium LSUCC0031]|nr:type II toxin-antitoxin system RelE/ParE family toxin [Rhodobacterales bacterium LSUCC0031]
MRLRLTQAAEADLRELYAEGLTVWGAAQADRYFDGVLDRFAKICAAPRQYQAVDHIRAGYRRSVYEQHSIYFVIDGDAVEVRAIVKRQDIGARI